MTFRNRLTLFFVLIVVVPMVSVAFVLFRLIADNESGKTDARIAARQEASIRLYQEARTEADGVALVIGRDRALAGALRADDRAALAARAEALRRSEGAQRVVIVSNGRPVVDVGDRAATFPSTRDLVDAGGKRFGRLQVSVITAREFAQRNRRVTGLDTVVRLGERSILASTIPGVDPSKLPDKQGNVQDRGETFRAATFQVPGFSGTSVSVTVLDPSVQQTSDVQRSRLLAGGILLGFFILAFTFAVIVSRSLQRQIDGFLQAARRLGSGDFSTEIPTSGRDEFAALGEEFNKMSRQLEERLTELGQERVRLQEAMRRIGETFASNLDRDALLDIVVKTAVDGVGGEVGRAALRDSEDATLEELARQGRFDGLEDVLRASEDQVLGTGRPAEIAKDGAFALSHPMSGEEPDATVSGVISVARHERPFSQGERELFHYLAGQAAVSIENVGLHQTVERQAVTDELTGLSNRRRFQDALAAEVERSKRFDQPVGLVMLDLDDFKTINDTYGHQQGDVVLREVAKILRDSSREIDEPARYGGEELAVVLPGTDVAGAFNLAERVRMGIERLEVPLLNGQGTIRVTASCGVATLPALAYDQRSLVEAADEALYRAKRTGKNKTVRAG
jgi:diguanylate cyclase (GGDEF)-like protein